jgi:hypothetical protein
MRLSSSSCSVWLFGHERIDYEDEDDDEEVTAATGKS